MRLNLKTGILLVGSVFLDAVQGFVLFNAALCAVPSITGIGVIITAVCAIAIVGIGALGSLFSLVWGGFAYLLTGEKLAIGVGVAEAIPGLNTLPIFTAASAYYIIKR